MVKMIIKPLDLGLIIIFSDKSEVDMVTMEQS